MLLEVENLVTSFPMKRGVVRAVDDVSFSLEKGKTLAIVGESGSGKSVTALSVMRLVSAPGRIDGGSIRFNGEDLLRASSERIQQIRGNEVSMIFQEPMTSLNPVYRIDYQLMESIMWHLKLSKEQARERALEMLRHVGIPSPEQRLRSYPHELSGGMRQRVMIAMALCCNPQLLIADEPTTALDVTIQAQILELLMTLRDQDHLGMLLITHDLGVVAEVADHVNVMYCGKIVESAPVFELFAHPSHPYTIGLKNSIPQLEADVKRLPQIPGSVPNPTEMPTGCAFRTRCDRACEECSREIPPLAEIAPGHSVRCFNRG